MAINPAAGQPAQPSNLVNVPRLVTAYFADRPDPKIPEQRVSFGTSGHRGSSLQPRLQRMAHSGDHAGHLRVSEGEGNRWAAVSWHRYACAVRAGALRARWKCWRRTSSRADRAQGRVHAHAGGLPTPFSTSIADRKMGLADGIVVTPSHNPPEDGGFKYNPPHGGPADSDDHRIHPDARQRIAGKRIWTA